MSKYDPLIDRYEQGIEVLSAALDGVPPELFDRAPAPGKWTIRQLAAHLADSELVQAARFRWVAAEPGTLLRAFDQEKWAGALQYERQTPQQALDAFRAVRRITASMLRNLPESAWTQTCRHEERGDLSLEQLVDSCNRHTERHAEQIRRIREGRYAAA